MNGRSVPGTALTALRISHFRSHTQARFCLDGRPVVLFGPNGAGKTNILEAVSMVSPGRGLRLAPPEELPQRPAGIGWKIVTRIQSAHQTHEIELQARPGHPRQTRIDGKAVAQTVLARIVRVLWLVPAMDRLWIEGAEGRRRFLDRMTMSFTPTHAEAALGYEKATRARNRLLKEGVQDARWYAALESQMAIHGARIVANRRGALDALARARETAQTAQTAFPVGQLSIVTPGGGMACPNTAEDLQTAFAESRPRDMAAGRTLVGPHRVDLEAVFTPKGMPARQCSTGEQKALLVSLVLANAAALHARVGSPPVLLLDEVAAHLDAGRRVALYDAICGLGAQAFLTGTDPELFVELGARASVYGVSETAGTSAITQACP